ncbi:hypothetical protein J4206_02950 [Candidatus Woesearchaeota archaeon]|nr:hypothetical protein [Candidatus Woesearchaeota archaeon]
MDDGNLTVYDDRLSELDIVEKVEALGIEPNDKYFADELKALQKETGLSADKILYDRDWREVVAVAKSVQYKDGRLYVQYKAISSYRFQAMKQGLVKQEGSQGYVNGVLITSDERIVLGVRSSMFLNNLISVVPAGSLRADKSDDVLNNSFYSELEQELGVKGNDMDVIGLIGHQRFTQGEDTYVFTYGARTNLTYDEVKDRHPSAKDASEHSRLFYLDNTLPAIETAIAELKDQMTPSTPGSLEILAEHKRKQGSDCGSCGAASNAAKNHPNNIIVLSSNKDNVFEKYRMAA